MVTYAYGFPRLGKDREYKKALESFWSGKSGAQELQDALIDLERIREQLYSPVDKFPRAEMSLYDPVLDAAFMFGVLPWKDLESYYTRCRGKGALAMTKYFNTNYHYLRPEISAPRFSFTWDKPAHLGISDPEILSVIGPFTLLKLSHVLCRKEECVRPLADAYADFFKRYPDSLFHIEEPAFVLDLSPEDVALARSIYEELKTDLKRMICMTYYDAVESTEIISLPFYAIGLDFIHGQRNLDQLGHLHTDTVLIAGLIDGRNVFPKDNGRLQERLQVIRSRCPNTLWVSNAAPLSHLPYSVVNECDPEIRKRFVFALEKIGELASLKKLDTASLTPATKAAEEREKDITLPDRNRAPARERKEKQKTLSLPLFPTTTIGSFPQSRDVRSCRNDFRKGKISAEEYERFIRKKIADVIRKQEADGFDVLVHGEFERTDMVEFFAEKLSGIFTTENGWIISYGSRAYRPPIIEGNVKRPKPMTLAEVTYAQSLTGKPVKGMLTGPVTIIAWSFVNPSVAIETIASEIGNALNAEVRDYIAAGIKFIQIDEPAFRERAPIKRRDWPRYFDWAVKSFKIAAQSPPEIQIHTHMCYSAFDEIIAEIDKLDADVISIEASRSKGEIIKAFESFTYGRGIGLGVWDVHSPEPPSREDMKDVLLRSLKQIPRENIWINPDCGLKTRNWEEIEKPLSMIPELAKEFREEG